MAEQKVTVTIAGGRISVSPDSIKVRKEHDNVRWVCDTGEFTIHMPGFKVDHTRENGKHHGLSGTFPTVGKIKYDVSAPGAATLDPEVDVIPLG
jgi:flavin reductase (DIM6/NTAB) family NADH-FMN oxidoreductase RutF